MTAAERDPLGIRLINLPRAAPDFPWVARGETVGAGVPSTLFPCCDHPAVRVRTSPRSEQVHPGRSEVDLPVVLIACVEAERDLLEEGREAGFSQAVKRLVAAPGDARKPSMPFCAMFDPPDQSLYA
ncbi:MAG: hypothetical protein KDK24_19035 [Pseudooceanicola sp.]|nr:hypothetical protein [Pseudooceanicola sp.]